MVKDLSILVCDDSALIRKKFRSILEKCGCQEVLEASDGTEAVELAKTHTFDVVFLDIVMPEKDGIEALKEIKQIQSNVKVIMASSVGTSSNLKEAVANGAYDFIQKPITFEAVVNLLEKMLKEESHV